MLELINMPRNSHQRCSRKKGVLKNFAKFIFATLLKKRLWHRCFPVNFAKILKTPFLTEHLWTTVSVCQTTNHTYIREIVEFNNVVKSCIRCWGIQQRCWNQQLYFLYRNNSYWRLNLPVICFKLFVFSSIFSRNHV